jgi:hypothetical protein
MDAAAFPMITRVFSAAVVGIDATEIEVEVNTGPGIPVIVVVGTINPKTSNCLFFEYLS